MHKSQADIIADLVEAHGVIDLDYTQSGEAWLWTADAIEYVISRAGKVCVNYVHPARRPSDRIAGLLTA